MRDDDEEEFDENDMMAAIEAERAEKNAGDENEEEFDENDMMAAIEAERAEKNAGDENEEEFDENDMMAAIEAERAEKNAGDENEEEFDENDMMAAIAQEKQEKASLTATTDAKLGKRAAVETIGIDLTAVLGVADIKVSNLLKIGRGAVIELDKKVGDPIELKANGQSIAVGDVVVVGDKLAISITDVLKSNN